ncbi:MAG TPA: exosortase system-associated protein, TIGR04073 family [Methylococcus sp.]|nr:exosortase system-associated protein, TIGR04073 family [Methylococcus sp.]
MSNHRGHKWHFPILVLIASLCTLPPVARGDDYASRTLHKLGTGLANLTLGWVEIPKSMIATTNQTNVLFGISGGLLKGILHTTGRTLAGALDLLTLPLPTRPIAQPAFVWQRFDTETRYGPVFALESDASPGERIGAPHSGDRPGR